MRKIAASLFILFFIASCVSNTSNVKSLIWKNPGINDFQKIKYIILPFEDHNAVQDKNDNPQASGIVRDAFETAMLAGGYEIVEYTQLEKEFEKKGAGIENKNNLILDYARKLGVSGVIHGVLTDYYIGSFFGRYTTVGFSVKAVEIESGQILWKAERSKTTQWDYDYDPALLAKDVSKEMVQELTDN